MVGIAGGFLLAAMSAFAQLCVGQQEVLADWSIFADGSLLAGLADNPDDRVIAFGTLLMLGTLLLDVVFIIIAVVCFWYYWRTRLAKLGGHVLLFLAGAGAVASWALIIPEWSQWAGGGLTMVEMLSFAGQDTKLLGVPLGLLAVIGGILYATNRKRFLRQIAAA
ncbi:MAG: hypothetical protein LBI33_09195 [Propionibacteriaceae bacterium]|nr:hypothetical protein [Propionibacteriaceae bacterium]